MYNASQTGLGWTSDGDILQTSSYKLKKLRGFDNFVRRLMFILRTEPNTYVYNPSVGVGLTRFVGRVNTRQTRNEIQDTIMTALLSNDIAYPYNPSVNVKYVNPQSIKISLSLESETFTYQTAIALNIKDGKLDPLDLNQTPTPTQGPAVSDPGSKAETKKSNKYFARKP